MADDIDIEEHDVMNNSYVKGMFPDLALVKTEACDHETSTGSPSVASDSLSLDENLRALRHIHEKYANLDRDDAFNAQLLPANHKQQGVEETDNTTIVDTQLLTPETGSNTLLASQPSTPDNTHIVSQPPTPETGNPTPVTKHPSTSETGNTTVEATQPSTSASEAIPDSTTDLDAQVLTRVADSPNIVSSTQEEEAASCDQGASNCIILGSKLTPQPSVPELPNIDDDANIDDIDYEHCISAAVDLQDWGPFLANSKSFCKECEILFATVNSFDAHKMQAHSFLVAVDKELERELSPEKPVESKKNKKQNCVLCTQSFDNEDELIQHFYVHLNKSLQCSTCDKTFNSKILLNEHKLTHDPEKSASKVVESASRIRKPSIKLLESAATTRDSTPSESNSRESSSKLGKATPQSKKIGFKCRCGCLFKQPLRLGEHYVYFHNEKPPSTFKTDRLDTICDKCQKSFSSLQKYNKHILSVHLKINSSNLYQTFLKAKTKMKHTIKDTLPLRANKPIFKPIETSGEPKEIPNKQEEKIVIPKSTLFKCSKCSVHFINSTVASSHFNNCIGLADNVYNCTKCNVKLKLSCEAAHEKQHRFGDNFNIHDVDAEDIRHRTLAQCPKCCVHYSEQSFWAHLEICNGEPSNKFSCSQCDINIDNNIKKTHEYGHKSLKFEADGFILIDYGEIGIDGTIDSTQNEHRGYLLYLCKTCKCFITFRKHKTSNCHYNASCKNIRKATCNVCGVVVTAGSLKRHLDYHQRIDGYTLDNFRFFSLLDNKPIKPIPEYAYCRICEIRFHSNVFLSEHNCKKTEHKTCKSCNLKFTDVAYKLHMPFHNLGGSQTTSEDNKEVSTALAFDITMNYCISCKCYFHKIRRHNDKQGRCNQKTENASLCVTCGLLCGNAGITHKQYHEKHGNFTLHDITFYRMPDRKRIKPPIPIYNPCKNCKIHFVTKRELKEHQCGKETSKVCEICDIKLSNKAHVLHMPFHSYRPNSMSDTEDSEAEDSEDVPSNKHKANEELEDIKGTKVTVSVKESANEVSEEEDLKGEYAKKKKFVFYECRYCKFAIVLKGDCKSHRCKTSQPNKRYTCKKCGLMFSKVMMKKHNYAHDSDPTYIRENFQLIPFSPLDSGVKKVILYKCSRCDVCMMDYTIREHFKRFCNNLNRARAACNKCNLKFAHETTHTHLHRKHPVLNKDTVEVTVIKSLQDYIDKIKKNNNKIFQCRRCKTILFSRQSVEDHKLSCKKTEEKLFFCNKCRLDIPDNEESLKSHNEYHSQNPEFVRSNISVIQFIPPKYIPKPTSSEKYTLYKCNRCQTCFLSPASVYRHGKYGHCGVSDTWKCKKCGFLIASTNLEHKRRHTLYPDMTRENIRVIVFEAGKVKHVETSDGAKHNKADKLEAKKSDRKIVLYVCKQCDVHCISTTSVSEHRSRPHVYKGCISACKLCGLKFSKFAMSHHIKVHHKQRGCKLDDFVIKEIQPFKKYSIGKADNTVEQPETDESDRGEHIAEKDEESESDVMEIPKKVVSRKRKHDGELVELTSVRIYQCTCRLNFMCRMDIKEHLKNCNGIDTKSGLKCSKCKLVFDANYLVRHSLKHHSSESDFEYNITEVNPLYSFLYRCGTCYTHFINEASLGSHVKECSPDDIQGRKCTKCNLLIHSTMIEKHKDQHLKLPNPTNNIKDTELITYNAPKKAEEGNAKSYKYILYKCNVCDVHFITDKQRDEHLKIANSVHSPNNYLLCKTCNLIISKDGFQEHSKDHHGTNASESYVNKRDKFLDKNLYYCNECQIHLLRLNTFENHHSTPGHGTSKKQNAHKSCRICGLVFTGISLLSHIRVHHEMMNLKLEDFNIIGNKPMDNSDMSKKHELKQESDENEEVTNNDESDSMSNDEPEVVKEKQKKPRIHIDTEDTKDRNPDIMTTQEVGNEQRKRQPESKETGDERTTVSSKIAIPKSQNIEDKIVYYRCKNCNVMFLNKKNCLEHLSSHSPMPEYDFMECKLCHKNFEVDALKPHMDHHKNDLSYEAVRIVEYKVEDNTSYDTGHSDHSSNNAEIEPTTSSKNSLPSHYDTQRIKKNVKTNEVNDKLNKNDENLEANDANTPDSEENSDEQSKSSKQAESDDENDSDNKFSCHMCSKKYKTDRARDIHVSLDHLDEEKQCPFCDRTFNLSILNDIHLCMSGDMFKCCICGNVFQQLLLESHAREGCLKE